MPRGKPQKAWVFAQVAWWLQPPVALGGPPPAEGERKGPACAKLAENGYFGCLAGMEVGMKLDFVYRPGVGLKATDTKGAGVPKLPAAPVSSHVTTVTAPVTRVTNKVTPPKTVTLQPGEACPHCGHAAPLTAKQKQAAYRARKKVAP